MSKITPPPALTADQMKAIHQTWKASVPLWFGVATGVAAARDQQWQDMLAQQQDRAQNFEEFGEGWESLAWELCAQEHGEEACSELIWEGGPIPEPWGDRWLKYEDEAKRLIALVHKHAAPVAQQADRQRVPDGWVNAVQKIADENEVEPSFVTMVFYDLLPVFMADKDAAGCVTLPLDCLIESDSYGVYGSDFYRCKVCGAESGAGVLNKGIQHNHNCPLAAAPEAPAQHIDDAAVDDFSQAMKYKLASARHKGREGWQTCPPEELSRMLREHVEKGDPLDVANFCMFLWWLGRGIAPAQASAVDERAAFEAWWNENGLGPLDFQWESWQARAALAQKGGK